jgi:hypothetical protein
MREAGHCSSSGSAGPPASTEPDAPSGSPSVSATTRAGRGVTTEAHRSADPGGTRRARRPRTTRRHRDAVHGQRAVGTAPVGDLAHQGVGVLGRAATRLPAAVIPRGCRSSKPAMCDAAPGWRQSVALALDGLGTGTACPGLCRRRWAECRATLDTSARSTREDGGAPWTVPSESTHSWLSPPWPYQRRRPSGCRARLLVPQVVMLLVDGIVIGLYVIGLGMPRDMQVPPDVGLGFVFGVPATGSTGGGSARRRAGAQPLLIASVGFAREAAAAAHDPKRPPHRRGGSRTVRPHHTA